ncbi:hypothetical protein JCM10213v2_001813 [Rhodosporidiobolus nylandii]
MANATRDRLVDLLATNQPREALRLFVHALSNAHETETAGTVADHALLFLQYRHPLVAFEAVAAMHSKGFAVPPSLAARLLSEMSGELEAEPEALVTVLAWFSEGMMREKAVRSAADEQVLKTVLEALLRLGREDWLAEVFRIYRATLGEGQVGSSRLWALAISAKAREGDSTAARALFNTWRHAFRASQHAFANPAHPPSAPYLTLLNYLISNSASLPPSQDPAYRFLAEIRQDGLAPSTSLLTALLRLELARSRFSSFWGLWQQFDALSVDRNASSWTLAVQAKLKADSLRKARQRGRKHNSPLLSALSFTYSEVHTPSSRDLFHTLLVDHLSRTNHRPSRRLPSHAMDCLTPDLLNSFLDLFVIRRDWPAATVVLETFRVHRLEPNARTHGSVVVGVVKQWEKGKLSGKLEEEGALGADPYGDSELQRRSRKRVEALGGPNSLALIRRILEGRKVRADLWAQQPVPTPVHHSEEVELEVEQVDQGEEPTVRLAQVPPSPEDRLTEMRNLEYLVSLLRRCTGMEKGDYDRAMEETRAELLPPVRKRSEAEDGSAGEAKEPITRRRRMEHYAYGARLRK